MTKRQEQKTSTRSTNTRWRPEGEGPILSPNPVFTRTDALHYVRSREIPEGGIKALQSFGNVDNTSFMKNFTPENPEK
jgi:hypothetical protein